MKNGTMTQSEKGKKKNLQTEDSRKEQKAIVKSFYDQFKAQYPQYFVNSQSDENLPLPKVAPSLKTLDLSNKQLSKISLKDIQKSVLCGTCLADSSLRIQARYKNARIMNRHSTRQASWFFWKWTVCLKEYINDIESIQYQYPDGYQKSSLEKEGECLGKLKVSTKCHPNLTALHSIICEKNRETIKRSWLNHMTDYFLMTIWLDDGSLYNKRQGVICLDSTPLDQQKVFVDYLKVVWGIDCFCKNTGKKLKTGEFSYRIYLKDQENLLKLLRIVAPIIPVKEMLYKIMFVPLNDPDLLQRWASEVYDLVLPEFQDYVKEKYKEILK